MKRLTPAYGELQANMDQTPAGMAHWAGTGPQGTTCRQCHFWGSGRPFFDSAGQLCPARCRLYPRLAGGRKVARGIPPVTPSCRYFQWREHSTPMLSIEVRDDQGSGA